MADCAMGPVVMNPYEKHMDPFSESCLSAPLPGWTVAGQPAILLGKKLDCRHYMQIFLSNPWFT